jgi:hypothetical protein
VAAVDERQRQEADRVDREQKELEEAITQSKAMLAGLKYTFGQELIAAQSGDGEYPTEERLQRIKALERDIANDEAFHRARELSRRRG